MGRFLRLFTELPLEEIARLESLEGAQINEAKAILATEATALCHGREEAEAAKETATRTFARSAGTAAGVVDLALEPVGLAGVEATATLAGGLTTIEIPRARLDEGVPVYVLLREAGLTTSNGEARRLIRGGGARVNDERFREETGTVGPKDLSGRGRHQALGRAQAPRAGARILTALPVPCRARGGAYALFEAGARHRISSSIREKSFESPVHLGRFLCRPGADQMIQRVAHDFRLVIALTQIRSPAQQPQYGPIQRDTFPVRELPDPVRQWFVETPDCELTHRGLPI